jgi:hypothetical protein
VLSLDGSRALGRIIRAVWVPSKTSLKGDGPGGSSRQAGSDPMLPSVFSKLAALPVDDLREVNMSRNQIRRLDSLIGQPSDKQLREVKHLVDAGPISRRARRIARRILSDIQANETVGAEVRQRALELHDRIPSPEITDQKRIPNPASRTTAAGTAKESIPAPSRREPPQKTFGACDQCGALGQLFWNGWDDPDADDLLQLLLRLDKPGEHKRLCAVCFESANQPLTEAQPRQ